MRLTEGYNTSRSASAQSEARWARVFGCRFSQVFRIERHRIDKRTGARTVKVVFGITSLTPAQADAKRLAAIHCGHWGIEK